MTKYNQPSRFLNEIPKEIIKPLYSKDKPAQTMSPSAYGFGSNVSIKHVDLNSFAQIRKPVNNAKTENGASFNIGERVVHKTFGTGTLLSKKPMGGDTLLEINFDKVGVKKIMANFAKLTKE